MFWWRKRFSLIAFTQAVMGRELLRNKPCIPHFPNLFHFVFLPVDRSHKRKWAQVTAIWHCSSVDRGSESFDSKQGDMWIKRKMFSIISIVKRSKTREEKKRNPQSIWFDETIGMRKGWRDQLPSLILWSIVNFIFFMFYDWNNCKTFSFCSCVPYEPTGVMMQLYSGQ